MKTFKTVSLRIMGLLLLSTFSMTAIAQSSQKIELENNRDDHKLRIYVSPINLVNPLGASVQLTAGKSLWKNGEVQLSYAHRLPGGNPMMGTNAGMFFIFSLETKYITGYRVGIEAQQILHRTKNIDFYGAGEFAVRKDQIETTAMTLLGLFSVPLDRQEELNSIYANVKLGMKYYMTDHFIIDMYCGVGYKEVSYQSLETSATGLSLPWNVKIGYQF